MSHLLQKHCVPCEGGIPAMEPSEIETHMKEIPDWNVIDDENTRIGRTWKLKNFVDAMRFVNAVADLAEAENHHPDIHVSYRTVTLELSTHAVGGLTENDFIPAAKTDALAGKRGE